MGGLGVGARLQVPISESPGSCPVGRTGVLVSRLWSHAVEDAVFGDTGGLCCGDGVEEVVGELREGGGSDPFRGSVARVGGQETVQHRAGIVYRSGCGTVTFTTRIRRCWTAPYCTVVDGLGRDKRSDRRERGGAPRPLGGQGGRR